MRDPVETLADFLGVPKTWIYERTRENGPEVIPHTKLGHSNVSTTGDIYTHVADQEMHKPADILGKAFAHSVAESAGGSKNVQ